MGSGVGALYRLLAMTRRTSSWNVFSNEIFYAYTLDKNKQGRSPKRKWEKVYYYLSSCIDTT